MSERSEPPRRVRPAPARARAGTAPCPVAGCGLLAVDGEAMTCQPREFTVRPGLADQIYPCPCPAQALLSVHLEPGGWRLRELRTGQAERAAHNLIAHALQAGQAFRDRGALSRPLTAPDPDAAAMERAFLAAHTLSRQACTELLAGHAQAALHLASQAAAAEVAYRHNARAYARATRAETHAGRWHNAGTFWIEVQGASPANVIQAAPRPQKMTFEFIALWNDAGAELTVVNAPDIERAAGLPVGPEAWAQLLGLLTRLESKPGPEPDARSLVWRDQDGLLVLREHVRRRYPRAVLALEALRRTLSPATPVTAAHHPDWDEELPRWVGRALVDV